MTVKSIVDIEINDGPFRAFASMYSKYQAQLSKSPEAWAKVAKLTDGTRKSFNLLVRDQMASDAKAKLMLEVQKKADLAARSMSEKWRDMARSTRDVAGNITRATGQLLRWASLTTVFSGLLGAGGLFGIDRLAGSVASQRRLTTGLGVGYGEKKSFDTNYGRLVDADSFLTNVNEVLHDVSKRYVLAGSGLGEDQVFGKNSAQVGALLIPALKKLADQTPDALLAQVLRARGLDNLIGLQEFQRLKNTSPEELAQIQRQYGSDKGAFSVAGSTQKAWQDFSVQMSRAGEKIENVFVKGLEPLTPALTNLSESFAETVKTFLSNPKLKDWIQTFGDSIERAAKYIGTSDFQDNVTALVEGVGKVASVLIRLGGGAVKVAGWGSTLFGGGFGTSGTIASRNNPGNLRLPGQSTGFASFSSEEEGIRAMARQLRLYQRRDKLSTISEIVSKYAPATENDVAAYVGDVSRRTGFGPNQKLDLSDNEQIGRLISAMTKHENSKSNYQPKSVVEILNSTGSNTIVTTNQVAR